MVRYLQFLVIFPALGAMPVLVQAGIFIGSDSKKESPGDSSEASPPTLFLKKSPSKNGKDEKSKASYNRRGVNTSGLLKHSLEDMQLASYWTETGREPQTVGERLIYASAMRADERVLMARRRVALFSYLQKDQQAAFKSSQFKKQKEDALEAKTLTKKKIYVTGEKNKSQKTLQKPPRVFTNFR